MRIFVQPPKRFASPDVPEGSFILLGNTWNDFSYRTLYTLLLKREGDLARIGLVKMLGLGQGRFEVPLELGEIPGGALSDAWCSLGADLDFYERLIELGVADQVMEALNDIAVDPARRAMFAEEDGFRKSLLRDHEDPTSYFGEIKAWLDAGAPPPDKHRFAFDFQPGGEGAYVPFHFGPPETVNEERTDLHPSYRTVVLVGRNGVGKTRLLAQLARVAYAPPSEREALKEDGVFEGTPAFPSIVAVSYSAFDTFDPPRLAGDNAADFVDQIRQGQGRYAYCGMRNLAAALAAEGGPGQLLSADDLEALFVQRIDDIRQMGRFPLLAAVLHPVLLEASFARFVEKPVSTVEGFEFGGDAWSEALLESFLGDDPGAAFGALSSGHKIVLHQLAGLTAVLQRRGLALIDEPETHLHPPLLAALMTALRTLLDRQHAYAVIATHSPVVVQETVATQVLKVEGMGDGAYVRPAEIETFGENIGTLTREIFGLATDASDYRRILERMAKEYPSVERLEKALGTELSPQALAHVMATLSRRGDA